MANNPNSDGQRETYHEVPASAYWYLGDKIGAVPKNFFKFWTPFTFFSGVVITAVAILTDWWQQLAYITLTSLFITHFYVGWPLTILVVFIFYIRHRRRKQRAAKLQAQRLRERKIQELLSDGGET